MILGDVSKPFAAKALKGIEEEAHEAGYQVIDHLYMESALPAHPLHIWQHSVRSDGKSPDSSEAPAETIPDWKADKGLSDGSIDPMGILSKVINHRLCTVKSFLTVRNPFCVVTGIYKFFEFIMITVFFCCSMKLKLIDLCHTGKDTDD